MLVMSRLEAGPVYADTSYVLLTAERGWTHDAVVDWACQALPRLLVED
jgi:hypothetical protein